MEREVLEREKSRGGHGVGKFPMEKERRSDSRLWFLMERKRM